MSSKPAHFVFVHGGGHGAWCWYKTVDLLRRAGHKATAVDLISCGRDYTDPNHVESFLDYNEPLMELLSNLPDNDKVDSLSISLNPSSSSFFLLHHHHLLPFPTYRPSSFQEEWVKPISDSDCGMMIFLHTHCSRFFCSGIVLSRNL